MLEAFLGALETGEVARYLRASRWGYAAVNAAHILGIALLVGAIVPLNLRLLGVWRGVDRGMLSRVLVPVAAAGLGLAVVAGLLLFAVRAREYAQLPIVQVKLALIAAGTLSAAAAHMAGGWRLERAGSRRLALHGLASLVLWIAALACGRLIAFVGD